MVSTNINFVNQRKYLIWSMPSYLALSFLLLIYISTFYSLPSLTPPNWPLGWAENNEALISLSIITSSTHLMTAVTVGCREKNDRSMVPSIPFTFLHQRLECTATHSIFAVCFNPFSCLTGSKHCIHHNHSLKLFWSHIAPEHTLITTVHVSRINLLWNTTQYMH